jgi:hypothetical protein
LKFGIFDYVKYLFVVENVCAARISPWQQQFPFVRIFAKWLATIKDAFVPFVCYFTSIFIEIWDRRRPFVSGGLQVVAGVLYLPLEQCL